MAMALWQQMSEQMLPIVAANDVGFHELEPRQLEVEEKEVFHTACKTLTAYMRGDFVPTKEEKETRHEVIHRLSCMCWSVCSRW
jgi:hypothetical protein